MKFRINKRWWTFAFKRRVVHKGDDLLGICFHKSRRIEVATSDVEEKEILDTIVHELLHATDRSKSEPWVARTARDISTVIWRLGYRRPRE